MAKQGRPRALDEAKRREVCAFMAAGASLQQAAEYVGCSVETLRREQKRNGDFDERMRRATANAQLIPLQAMRSAVQTHWRAAAWMLERSDPEHFGRQKEHFGAKELQALRRDLIDIFEEEIKIPNLRNRVVRRVKAAIDYAMRHAWDRKRTGSKLREAMKFFEQREVTGSFDKSEQQSTSEDFLTAIQNRIDAELQQLDLEQDLQPPGRDSESAAERDRNNPQMAKVVPFCAGKDRCQTGRHARNESDDPQKE